MAAQQATGTDARNAARNAVGNAAREAAEVAAQNAVALLGEHDTVNHSPPPYLIGITAYRSAELAVQIVVLKQSAVVVRRVFADTLDRIRGARNLTMLPTIFNWEACKEGNFSRLMKDENHRHFLRPWLGILDKLVRVMQGHPEVQVD